MPKTDEAVAAITNNAEWLERLALDAERRLANAMEMVSRYARAYGTDTADEAYADLMAAHSGNFNTPEVN